MRADTARARQRAKAASEASRHVAVQLGANLAHALCELMEHSVTGWDRLGDVLIHARTLGCLDSVITAQQAFPEIMRKVADPRAREVLDHAKSTLAVTAEDGNQTLQRLTRREREVAELLASGMSNRDISRRLFIEPSTTKVHVRRILKKLDADSRIAGALRFRELQERDSDDDASA
jgi:ATP/maltotriose-dependent transcriptional regulator MalT